MRSLAHGFFRAFAAVLMFLMVIAPAAECAAAAMTPEQRACCAAMKGDCKTSIGAHCCDHERQEMHGFVAAKSSIGTLPVAVLVAVLSAPPIVPVGTTHIVDAPEASSSGPPGVATYLFVSSFRI